MAVTHAHDVERYERERVAQLVHHVPAIEAHGRLVGVGLDAAHKV